MPAATGLVVTPQRISQLQEMGESRKAALEGRAVDVSGDLIVMGGDELHPSVVAAVDVSGISPLLLGNALPQSLLTGLRETLLGPRFWGHFPVCSGGSTLTTVNALLASAATTDGDGVRQYLRQQSLRLFGKGVFRDAYSCTDGHALLDFDTFGRVARGSLRPASIEPGGGFGNHSPQQLVAFATIPASFFF